MEAAFEFIEQNQGLTTRDNYPYMGQEGTCKSENSYERAAKITGYEDVPRNSEQALLQAVYNQPVSVAIDASGDFRSYTSGVYSGTCGTTLDHAVTAVGYGTNSDGTKYWLVKNSWGSGWGENGYMRLERDLHKPEETKKKEEKKELLQPHPSQAAAAPQNLGNRPNRTPTNTYEDETGPVGEEDRTPKVAKNSSPLSTNGLLQERNQPEKPCAGPTIATSNRNCLAVRHQIGIDQGGDRRGTRKARHDRCRKRGQKRQRGKGRAEGERRRGLARRTRPGGRRERERLPPRRRKKNRRL
ncbi:hypothetical protein RHGRI_037703 [Rhododendron griersonianum]|uniref:Peptidase C1A papain C-terminal domain-containing protein n=1 Tax=Rhododendron griersonianum TaxID=479676 RepID=A0AAV6HT37_9ERIC|nr:hypothetical protein RHGRI_037703 [Rhododendron griersonianum]